jgi:hypothetical protein
MIITGTSLHDFPRTMAGYEIYESAAKPKGAAEVMKTEHWRYLRSRGLREYRVDTLSRCFSW